MGSYGALRLKGYPNVNEEMIPDKLELTRTFNVIRRHEDTIRTLEPQREETIATRDDLRTSIRGSIERVEVVTLEVQKELKAAKRSLIRICNQITAAQADLDVLRGDMHPIRRSPTDILQYILEMVVDTVSTANWCNRASNISAVCYRWRLIALHTPMIWSRVILTVERCPLHSEAMWEQTVNRIKSWPAVILIKGITEDDASRWALLPYRLDLLPRIDSLTLRFTSDAAAERFTTEEWSVYTNPIRHLAIEGQWDAPNINQTIRTQSIFSSKLLLNVRELELANFQLCNLDDDNIFPHIFAITVCKSRNLQLDRLAKVFPRVTTVKLHRITKLTHSYVNIEWRHVTLLIVESTRAVPWKWLKLPKVVDVRLYQKDGYATFCSFLESQPFILHLETRSGHIENVLGHAPQLLSYGMGLNGYPQPPQAPRVPHLTLYQRRPDELSLSLFEQIICEHFLPSSQKGRCAEEGESLPSLAILVPEPTFESAFELPWQKSQLLKNAVESRSTVERWGDHFKSYRFVWK